MLLVRVYPSGTWVQRKRGTLLNSRPSTLGSLMAEADFPTPTFSAAREYVLPQVARRAQVMKKNAYPGKPWKFTMNGG